MYESSSSYTAFWHFFGSLDGPGRADEKARPASGFGLRAVRSRIPAHAGHARSGPGTTNSLLRRSCAVGSWNRSGEVPSCVGPPPGLRRGWNVDEFYEEGGPALHACLGPTGIRSARLSQGETPLPTKNKSAVTGLGPSLDGPGRTGEGVRSASELDLWAVRPRMPAHAGHTRPGPRVANFLLRRSYADG